MGATTRNSTRRPFLLRRLAAVSALAALLLLGAMTTAAVAAPRTAPAVHKDVAPAVQPVPSSQPSSFILPLVLGGIVMLAVIVPFPMFYPRYGYRGGHY